MTQTKITECTDERQLCEWAAVYCMGWKLGEVFSWEYVNGKGWERFKIGETHTHAFHKEDGVRYGLNTNDLFLTNDYWPTKPTEKGKAQCWDLAVKYHCWPRLRNGKYVVFVDNNTEVEHEGPQIAVVKAAILVALNGEEL